MNASGAMLRLYRIHGIDLLSVVKLFVIILSATALRAQMAAAELPKPRLGESIVARRDTIVITGKDKGECIDDGFVLSCTEVNGPRLRVSGINTGWVDAADFCLLRDAESEWGERLRHDPCAKNVAILAYVQLLTGKEAAARQTIESLGELKQSDPYVRTIQAIVAARDENEGGRLIHSLCADRVLTPELAAMLASRLLDDAISKDLAKLVVDSCAGKDCSDNVELLLCKADTFDRPDLKGEAVRYAEQAIHIDPFYGDGRHILASILEGNQSPSKAIQVLEEGIRICPDYTFTYRYLGYLEIEDGRTNDGMKHLSKAVPDTTSEPDKCYQLGQLLLNRLQMQPCDPIAILPQAENQFQRACELTKYQRTDYISALCYTYVRQGKTTTAHTLIAKLLDKLPRYDEKRIELEVISDSIEKSQ